MGATAKWRQRARPPPAPSCCLPTDDCCDLVVVEEPIELAHGSLPRLPTEKWHEEAEEVAEEDRQRPPCHVAPIGIADELALVQDLLAGEEGCELVGGGPVHGVDGVVVLVI